MIHIGKKLTSKELAKITKLHTAASYHAILEQHNKKEQEILAKELSRKARSDKGVKRTKYSSSIPKRMRSYIGRANKKGIAFTLSIEEFDLIKSRPCVYCGSSQRITIDRKDSSCGYTIDNSQPCCVSCNMMKFSYSEETFLKQVFNIYRHRLHKF